MSAATAFWLTGPRQACLRAEGLSAGDGEIEIEALFSAISRGTESLVFEGHVPESEWTRMRCPFQEGDFSFPVKYGYASVGRIVGPPTALTGRMAFVLHPHQSRYFVPIDAVFPLPEQVPPGRAILAANLETALNIVWDAGVLPGDRVAIVGAGVVGALAAWLCARIPATAVTLVDVNQKRGRLADALGCAFAGPGDVPADCDVVIHASATSEGLATAVAAAGFEARIIEASWYGTRPVKVELGGAFHSRRLQLVSSQVGDVPPGRRARWSRARRLGTALDLLADDRLDALISGESPFNALPELYAGILSDPDTLCHRIRYGT
jgi:2-desacetyl-2-hydroxyethyl bacteriochlorophyllide A dehydrogenase